MRRTFLIAVDLIGAVVFTVVEVVAAEDGADAASAGALELIFLAHGYRGRHFWKQACDFWFVCFLFCFFIANVTLYQMLTAFEFIAVVAAIVDTVTSFGERQTHAIVEAAELPGGRTLKFD